MNTKPKVLCILGPTASGKTEMALQAAEQFNGEIINVDSAQVYIGMDIGTAKLDIQARQKVPHYLFDIRQPFDAYSASDFCTDATECIRDIHSRGRLPILAGGTMLYFRALFKGMADLPSANEEFRRQLESRAKTVGWEQIHGELGKVDAESQARIKPTDRQRIQRALEVFHVTGVPLSVLHSEQPQKKSAFTYLKVALIPEDRSVLHQIIKQRFHQMMQDGLLDEVRQLIDLPGFDRDSAAMRAVGYRQLINHILDAEPLPEAVQKAIYASRQLAKRQLTWLRKMQDIEILEAYEQSSKIAFDSLVNKFIHN